MTLKNKTKQTKKRILNFNTMGPKWAFEFFWYISTTEMVWLIKSVKFASNNGEHPNSLICLIKLFHI